MSHHGGTERTECPEASITGHIIAAAIEVHKSLGPGLLESSYLACLAQEVSIRGMHRERQRKAELWYKGVLVPTAYRIDLLVEGRVIIEVKAVEMLSGIHTAQLLTYLKLMHLRVGLLLNFNVQALVKGVRRVVNGY